MAGLPEDWVVVYEAPQVGPVPVDWQVVYEAPQVNQFPIISQEFQAYYWQVRTNLIPNIFRDNGWMTMSDGWFPDPLNSVDIYHVGQETNRLCQRYGWEQRDKYEYYTSKLIMQAKVLCCEVVNVAGLNAGAQRALQTTRLKLQSLVAQHEAVIRDLEAPNPILAPEPEVITLE